MTNVIYIIIFVNCVLFLDDKDICEKAMKFTRCIYTHRNEV